MSEWITVAVVGGVVGALIGHLFSPFPMEHWRVDDLPHFVECFSGGKTIVLEMSLQRPRATDHGSYEYEFNVFDPQTGKKRTGFKEVKADCVFRPETD